MAPERPWREEADSVALRTGTTARLKTPAVSGEPGPLLAALETLVGPNSIEGRS